MKFFQLFQVNKKKGGGMDFIDQLQTLAKHIEKLHSHITTEEATKNAFVLPFLQILGFSIFDPTEVFPGFTVNVGGQQDRVDYAIFIDEKPAMLFECKSCDFDLDKADVGQLSRCFRGASAAVGVLTNGEKYFFYSDLERQNVMDDQPFMKFDLRDVDTPTASQVQKFSKKSFSLDQVLTTAKMSKCIPAIKNAFVAEYSSPSLEFVRFFAKQADSTITTPQALEQFAPTVKVSFQQFVEDRINERLTEKVGDKHKRNKGSFIEHLHNPMITDEEFEAFFVVKVT